nr:hypothetical protein [Treponema socranskii]
MKTKKSTKYSSDFVSGVLQDIFVVLFSLAVIGCTAFLFFNNLNKTIERNDKTPVATVSQHETAVQVTVRKLRSKRTTFPLQLKKIPCCMCRNSKAPKKRREAF